VAPDVAIVELRLPINENLRFAAGQYLDFVLENGVRRSYSIATPPAAAGLIALELHIRHTPGGMFTDPLFDGAIKPGQILHFEAPLGTFSLREESDKPIVFVASGTGFAPIKAIIGYIMQRKIPRPMTLYWGGRQRRDLYMDELARHWESEWSGFKYVPVLSEAAPEEAWRGRAGFVHRAVMQDLPDLSGHQVYACGAPVMVEAARKDFTAQCGLPEGEFFADSFLTQAELVKATA
jgi:CDP-4-dehydro-6-deoxyglucose reductase